MALTGIAPSAKDHALFNYRPARAQLQPQCARQLHLHSQHFRPTCLEVPTCYLLRPCVRAYLEVNSFLLMNDGTPSLIGPVAAVGIQDCCHTSLEAGRV